MKSTFKISTGNEVFIVVPTEFNGGEINVRLDKRIGGENERGKLFRISANISDSQGVMALLLIKDALDRMVGNQSISLYLGYFPYARQDRVCNAGEALSVKVMCDLINSMNFANVVILDPHSDVTGALLNNVRICPPELAMESSSKLVKYLKDGALLVAPDAGAAKKVQAVSEYFGGIEVIQGIKKREMSTGALSGFGYIGDVEGKDLLLVDDICDGGGTFIGLAQKLKQGGAKSMSLYVSHGIFSNNVFDLLHHFDTVYTTDSVNSGITDARVIIIQGD